MAPPSQLLYTDPRTGELRRRRWRLEVLDGADVGLSCELEQNPALIGAAPAAALNLTDDTVSRYHLEIDAFAEGLRIRDLDSTNGTFVRGVRVRDAFLEAGESFRIGRTVIRLDASSERSDVDIATNPMMAILGHVERIGEALAVSAPMRGLFEILRAVARAPSTVLLGGEPGVGKATMAALIHHLSPLRARPYVTVEANSARDPAEVELDLFGRSSEDGPAPTRGAFERANGGSLFIEGVDRLSGELQRRVLRVIESGEVQRGGEDRPRRVDVRLVAATSGAHREISISPSLLRRLAVVQLIIPPLRDRREDIVPLAEHFLRGLGAPQQIGPRLGAELEAEDWPGNLDELKDALRAITSPSQWIPTDAPNSDREAELRRAYVGDLLAGHMGNVGVAAKALQVPARALFHFLSREQVDLDEM